MALFAMKGASSSGGGSSSDTGGAEERGRELNATWEVLGSDSQLLHRSLYSNLYLIRISLSPPLRLFTLAVLRFFLFLTGLRGAKRGRARVEGSDVDMGLLLISAGGGGKVGLSEAPGEGLRVSFH